MIAVIFDPSFSERNIAASNALFEISESSTGTNIFENNYRCHVLLYLMVQLSNLLHSYR